MKDLKKIELHLHLEGAAPPAFIRGLAAEKNMDLPPIFDAKGELESFSQVANPGAEPPFLINGVRRPTLVLRPGQVERWRAHH